MEWPIPAHFIIRDQSFEVSKVTSHDVIHAGPKLVPSIFKISCNQPGCVGLLCQVLILTENEAEKDRWITTLKELQKATKQSPNQLVRWCVCGPASSLYSELKGVLISGVNLAT